MSLLDKVSLKFQTFKISQIFQYFLLEKFEKLLKASLIFSTKNFSVFGYKVVKRLTSWSLKKLIKPRMLWITGPRYVGWIWYFFKITLKQLSDSYKQQASEAGRRCQVWCKYRKLCSPMCGAAMFEQRRMRAEEGCVFMLLSSGICQHKLWTR